MESDTAGFGGDAVTQQSTTLWMQCLAIPLPKSSISRGSDLPSCDAEQCLAAEREGLAVGSHGDGAV